MMNHHHPQDTGMQGMNSHNTHHSHQSAYQQPLYLTGHEHGLGLNVRYVISNHIFILLLPNCRLDLISSTKKMLS